MTSRADSLTHEDLQKAEIERLRAALANVRSDFKSECERRDEIIISTTKLWNDVEADNIKLRAALAEARGLLEAFYRADIDPHKYDRTARWLERNP